MIWDASNFGCLSGKVKHVVELRAAQVFNAHHTDDQFPLGHLVLHTKKKIKTSLQKGKATAFFFAEKMPVHIFLHSTKCT